MSVGIDLAEKQRRDRARIKLAVTILTTYGYALLGSGAWEPLMKGQYPSTANLTAGGMGLALHLAALYIAPNGEAK
jgi:hypothetical protein